MYDHKKLSHIDIEVKGAHKGTHSLLDCFIPGGEIMMADMCFSDSKRERYDFSAASIDYIWEGDNVGYMKMRLTRPDSIQKLTFSYEAKIGRASCRERV